VLASSAGQADRVPRLPGQPEGPAESQLYAGA